MPRDLPGSAPPGSIIPGAEPCRMPDINGSRRPDRFLISPPAARA
jgi:hypothetical protein